MEETESQACTYTDMQTHVNKEKWYSTIGNLKVSQTVCLIPGVAYMSIFTISHSSKTVPTVAFLHGQTADRQTEKALLE